MNQFSIATRGVQIVQGGAGSARPGGCHARCDPGSAGLPDASNRKKSSSWKDARAFRQDIRAPEVALEPDADQEVLN